MGEGERPQPRRKGRGRRQRKVLYEEGTGKVLFIFNRDDYNEEICPRCREARDTPHALRLNTFVDRACSMCGFNSPVTPQGLSTGEET